MKTAFVVCLLSTTGIAVGLYSFHSGWLAILLYHAVLLGAMLLGKPRKVCVRAIVLGYRTVPALGLVLLSCLAGWGLFCLIHRLDPSGSFTLRQLSRAGFTVPALVPFALYASVINPILEELFWRGNYAVPRGWIFDIFYALLHLPMFCFFGKLTLLQLPIPVLGLVMAGLVWRLAARRLGGLASGIIGHGAGDLAFLVAIGWALG